MSPKENPPKSELTKDQLADIKRRLELFNNELTELQRHHQIKVFATLQYRGASGLVPEITAFDVKYLPKPPQAKTEDTPPKIALPS